MICFDVDSSSLHLSAEDVSDEMEERQNIRLRECSVKISNKAPKERQARRFRARLMENMSEEWSIFEVWMRGKLRRGEDRG